MERFTEGSAYQSPGGVTDIGSAVSTVNIVNTSETYVHKLDSH